MVHLLHIDVTKRKIMNIVRICHHVLFKHATVVYIKFIKYIIPSLSSFHSILNPAWKTWLW